MKSLPILTVLLSMFSLATGQAELGVSDVEAAPGSRVVVPNFSRS